MKKFCNKITKQQWRLTVPNVNTSSIFKRTPKIDRDDSVKSGSYDLEQAQKEYDRSRSVPNSVFIETDSSDSDNYQDATTMSDKRSSAHTDDEGDVYEDADNKVVLISKNLTDTNAQFEYDVPKISFSFFENKQQEDEYATVIPKSESTPTHKSEVKIVLASPESFEDDDDSSNSDRNSEKDVSDTEVVIETKTLTKELTEFPAVIMKCGSDPNISYRTKEETDEILEDEADDGLYKVPRRLHRLSQSLNDFNIENIETISSAHSSIEHISCSQVIPQETSPPPEELTALRSSQNSESMDYCKTRSKLPLRLRRATLLRKPKAKAVDTWMNLRSRFNNMITEHSIQQQENKEKHSINIQEVYNNSRDKCKKVLKNTGRIFKRNQENVDPNNDNSSQIIKNHAFFANLKASDIEYKLNYSNNSEEVNKSESIANESNNSSKVLSRSTSDEKKEEFDFNTIKSAFRRSKLITSTEVS